jgi:hypothetical protein
MILTNCLNQQIQKNLKMKFKFQLHSHIATKAKNLFHGIILTNLLIKIQTIIHILTNYHLIAMQSEKSTQQIYLIMEMQDYKIK